MCAQQIVSSREGCLSEHACRRSASQTRQHLTTHNASGSQADCTASVCHPSEQPTCKQTSAFSHTNCDTTGTAAGSGCSHYGHQPTMTTATTVSRLAPHRRHCASGLPDAQLVFCRHPKSKCSCTATTCTERVGQQQTKPPAAAVMMSKAMMIDR